MATLTHGLPNGLERWPEEIDRLERMGVENLDEIERTLARYGVDCSFERTGELNVATEPWQLDALHEHLDLIGSSASTTCRSTGIRCGPRSTRPPTWAACGSAAAAPWSTRPGWHGGCARPASRLGVRVYERTPVRSLHDDGVSIGLRTPHGAVTARRVALGTGVFPPLLRRLRHFVVPVYDYALTTEPLSDAQLAEVGWRNRQGVGDAANQFHYYRLTDDNRILWGGYDAVYYNGGTVKPEYDQRDETFAKLAGHFYDTFPQLEEVRFSHRWGGVIDTCSRFSAFYGQAHGGRLAYAVGYTGMGVGATRFGANVMLDLLSGERTERTELRMVKEKPVPFPPEPVRSGVIQFTRWSIAQADQHQGRRNLWLRALDRMGLGFDS